MVVGSLVAGIDVRRIVAEILLIFVGNGCGEMFSLGGLQLELNSLINMTGKMVAGRGLSKTATAESIVEAGCC